MINYRNIEEIAAAIRALTEESAELVILQEVSDDKVLGGREFITADSAILEAEEIEQEMPWYGKITPEREAFQTRIRTEYAADGMDPNKFWEPHWLMIRIMGKGPEIIPIKKKNLAQFYQVIKERADSLMQSTWIPEIRFLYVGNQERPNWVEVIFKVSYSS
jgi:hypothetical protein